MHIRSMTAAGLALAGCGLLAACGATAIRGTSSLGQVTPPPVSSAPASGPPATHPPKPPKPGTPPPTPAHGPAGLPCTTRGVKVTAGQQQGAAGTSVTMFTVTNIGTGPCEMDRWPFIAPYGPLKQGGSTVEANLDVTVGKITTSDGGPVLGAVGGLLGLAPGDTAVFYLKWSHLPVNNTDKCPQADGFDFRPPQDPSTDDNLLVTYAFAPCGDTLGVSQVLPPS